MITERRRNNYAGTCNVCSKPVDAGQGWLYCDTKSHASKSRFRNHRKWNKVVKCDRCHTENLSNRWQAENLDNPKPAEPVVRPWSIASVKKWTLELAPVEVDDDGIKTTDVELFLVGPFGRQLISCRERISNAWTASHGYSMEEFLKVDGKPISKTAVNYLTPLVVEIINEVNRKVHDEAVAAVARLGESGVIVTKNPYFDDWHIKMGEDVLLGSGPYKAIAIELTVTGDYFNGCKICGFDRRTGVSEWRTFSVEDVIAIKKEIDAPKA